MQSTKFKNKIEQLACQLFGFIVVMVSMLLAQLLQLNQFLRESLRQVYGQGASRLINALDKQAFPKLPKYDVSWVLDENF